MKDTDTTTATETTQDVFHVEPYSGGFTIYTRGGWGCGHVFTHRAYAESACRALNNNAALDAEQ